MSNGWKDEKLIYGTCCHDFHKVLRCWVYMILYVMNIYSIKSKLRYGMSVDGAMACHHLFNIENYLQLK